jgi:ABC-type nickel/cobalt efflux system permease component RcnA
VFGLDGTLSLFAGAVALGVIHGAEPGHGWPIAATYALDRQRTWFHGFAASFLLGLGHLVSSIAVVVVFFLAKDYFGLTQLGWVRYVAGVLLIALGIREYYYGHTHSHDFGGDEEDDGHARFHEDAHGHEHDDHTHDDHDHSNGHSGHENEDGHEHGHDHDHFSTADVDERGLWGIVTTAFVLGFAHEEEFEIIGLCLGSNYCLELMLVYAIAVLVALVALTLLLVAGYERYEDRVAGLAQHFPTLSAVVLVLIGLGFIFGVV